MKKLTPIKAIRAKCLDCVCFQLKEVKLCPSDDCPLWPYRMGKNPNRKSSGTVSPKQLEARKKSALRLSKLKNKAN